MQDKVRQVCEQYLYTFISFSEEKEGVVGAIGLMASLDSSNGCATKAVGISLKSLAGHNILTLDLGNGIRDFS